MLVWWELSPLLQKDTWLSPLICTRRGPLVKASSCRSSLWLSSQTGLDLNQLCDNKRVREAFRICCPTEFQSYCFSSTLTYPESNHWFQYKLKAFDWLILRERETCNPDCGLKLTMATLVIWSPSGRAKWNNVLFQFNMSITLITLHSIILSCLGYNVNRKIYLRAIWCPSIGRAHMRLSQTEHH